MWMFRIGAIFYGIFTNIDISQRSNQVILELCNTLFWPSTTEKYRETVSFHVKRKIAQKIFERIYIIPVQRIVQIPIWITLINKNVSKLMIDIKAKI